MSKNWLVLSISIAVLSFLAFYVWSSHRRYYIASSGNLAYEIDRKTGKTWLLRGATKIPQEEPKPIPQIKSPEISELPETEIDKVSGRGGITYTGEELAGTIHNGSNWIITKLIVKVVTKEKDGGIEGRRDYVLDTVIRPLTAKDFYITIVGGKNTEMVNWSISKVYGYSERHENLKAILSND